jgi:hypothetical protein
LKAIFHYIQAAEAGKEVAAFNVAWLSETCQVVPPMNTSLIKYFIGIIF